MNRVYYVYVKLFDTFEEISSLIKEMVIATDENNARDIVAKQLEEEIKFAKAPCAGYEIFKVEFIKEL